MDPHSTQPKHILHLDDSASDAELIADELCRAWPNCEIRWVDSRDRFEGALREGRFDVILSDYALRDFDGLTALQLVRASGKDVPFILVSGTIGEEVAVSLLKAGAIDYVLKDRPARLIPAIERALRDMAEQRSRQVAEQNVRETEERFRQLAESSNDVFWFADLNPFKVRYVRPAVESIWGRLPADFYADADLWFESVHPEDRARVERNFNAWVAGEQLSFAEEFRVVRADGSMRWVHDTGTVNLDSSGKVKRVSGVVRDITQTKEAAEQGLRAQRLESIGLLAGGVAHDLNNALAPILMGLELMRPELTSGMVSLHANMQQSANRGAAMVRQLLGFARGAEGHKAIVDPRRALREVEQLAHSTFSKGIETTVNSSINVAAVEIDPTLLHQVLLNLCVNARDAMPQGGKLTLEAQNTLIDESYAGFIRDAKPGPYVVFIVSDTGTGIPPDVLPKIFDPFFTTKPTGFGTGLGLTTVAGIAHNHGGFVRVYSEAGSGTTFKIYVPAARRASAPPFPPAGNLAPEYRADGEGVLVVDDEEPIRVLLKSLLERIGFRVYTTSDGTEALATFASHRDRIKLVLTDERMPHLDGLALVRALRHMAPELRIIAMSGLHSDVRVKEFATHGVKHFLHKPFAMPELVAALRACLETSAGQPELKLGE